jgi:hypothetical protein
MVVDDAARPYPDTRCHDEEDFVALKLRRRKGGGLDGRSSLSR